MMYLGDFEDDKLVCFCFCTNDKNGAAITYTGGSAPNYGVSIYRDDDTVENTTGIVVTKDFDGITGIHNFRLDLAADTFYATEYDYSIVLSGVTIDGETVNAVLATFSIENRFAGSSVFKKAAKLLVNKAVQNKATGRIDYYDDDGATVILTHTPADTESSITRTPS